MIAAFRKRVKIPRRNRREFWQGSQTTGAAETPHELQPTDPAGAETNPSDATGAETKLSDTTGAETKPSETIGDSKLVAIGAEA